MMRLVMVAGAALVLSACEMSVKTDGDGGGNGTGAVSVQAPGIGLNVNLPAMLKAEIAGGSDLIFPGATMSGLKVNALAGPGDQPGGQSSVQLRFETPAAVREVLAWYQDPARALAMTGLSVEQVGSGGYRINGRASDGGGPFSLELAPKAGGGTQAELSLRDAA